MGDAVRQQATPTPEGKRPKVSAPRRATAIRPARLCLLSQFACRVAATCVGLATAALRLAHVRSGAGGLACGSRQGIAQGQRIGARKRKKPATAGAGRARKDGELEVSP